MRMHRNGGGHHHTIDSVRAVARETVEDGLAGLWLSQTFALDSLTALAVVADDAPGIELGTSVVPIYGRHPLNLAMQALTVQSATGGRLVLGIGPSHQLVVEMLLGESYAKPYTHTAAYLDALLPLLAGEPANVATDELTARGRAEVDAPAPPVLVAALGPRMLRLAGSRTDGVALWMTGPKTIASRVTPILTDAATEAGRPPPRILAGISVCVTDDPSSARARAAEEQAVYGTLPAYQAVLAAEGVTAPEDLLIAGDASSVRRGIGAYADAGVTDVRASIIATNDGDYERTRTLLSTLARE
jgi:F420-dependent oxidoreductase-like protein